MISKREVAIERKQPPRTGQVNSIDTFYVTTVSKRLKRRTKSKEADLRFAFNPIFSQINYNL